MYFKNLKTGKLYPEEITMAGGPMVWAGDNKTIFYPGIDDSLRFYKIFKHTLGTPSKDDQLVFHESDDTFSVYVRRSRSKKYILNQFQQHPDLGIPVSLIPASLRVSSRSLSRAPGLEYEVDHLGDRFLCSDQRQGQEFQAHGSAARSDRQGELA